MVCPQCGGAERAPIAPGLWMCTTLLPHRVFVPSGNRFGDMRPHDDWIPCQHRYHDGEGASAGAPQCMCGTFAIGKCHTCDRWVCGEPNCSGMEGGRRLCAPHYRSAVQAREAAELAANIARFDAERAAEREAGEQARRTVRAFLDAAKAAGFPGATTAYATERNKRGDDKVTRAVKGWKVFEARRDQYRASTPPKESIYVLEDASWAYIHEPASGLNTGFAGMIGRKTPLTVPTWRRLCNADEREIDRGHLADRYELAKVVRGYLPPLATRIGITFEIP